MRLGREGKLTGVVSTDDKVVIEGLKLSEVWKAFDYSIGLRVRDEVARGADFDRNSFLVHLSQLFLCLLQRQNV